MPVEDFTTDHFIIERGGGTVEGERREQALVHHYRGYLESKGHKITRHKYERPSASALYCDLYDETADVLYEAKGAMSRSQMRMAIGQLFDHRHLEQRPVSLAVLLPRQPADDIRSLFGSLGIAMV